MTTPSQRQILEAVLESLPKDETDCFHYESFEDGYNSALHDVRAIINEFLKTEGKS